MHAFKRAVAPVLTFALALAIEPAPAGSSETGSGGADRLVGGNGPDQIEALGGNDVVR